MTKLSSDHRGVHRVRQWGAGIGVASGAGLAAALIAVAAAHADDADGLVGQAASDLSQANSVLESAPTTSLDAQDLSILVGFESEALNLDSFVLQQEPIVAGLPAADQTSPLLLDADQQLVQGSQGLLDADQTYVAAIQAGDFASTASSSAEMAGRSAEFGVDSASFGTIPGVIDAGFVDIVAQLLAHLGLPF